MKNKYINFFEKAQFFNKHLKIYSGDFIRLVVISTIHKKKFHTYNGIVLSFRRNGISSSFIIRSFYSSNESVDLIFFYHSPLIVDITVIKKYKTKKANLRFNVNFLKSLAK